jgi:hypothetical protein
MQARKITLIEIGAGALPEETPVVPRYASWFPVIHTSPEIPPVDGVIPEPIADGVLIEWTPVNQAGVIYIIERGPTQQGPWTEIHRTTDTRYLYSDGSGQTWFFRITAAVRGKPGQGTVIEATPAPTTSDLVEQQQKLAQEIADRFEADAQEAAARAAGLAQAAEDLAAESQARAAGVSQAMDAVEAEAQARGEALLNEQTERTAAITELAEIQQSDHESFSRALSEVAAGSGAQFDSKRVWYFDDSVEGWTGNGDPGWADGWLRPANASSFPYVQSPDALEVDGATYSYVKLRVRRVGTPEWAGVVQWVVAGDLDWTPSKSMALSEPVWDRNGIATVTAADIPWVTAQVEAFRLQPGSAQTVSDYYLIDWVAVGRPTPGAGVALVQQEVSALVDADRAEATQRETLAVQLRGDYEGGDLGSVSTGLIAIERDARVEADEAMVRVVEVIKARLPPGEGALATEASVISEREARVSEDQALAEASQQIKARLPDGDGMVASVEALESVSAKVDDTEQGLVAMGERVVSLTAQLDGPHAGDEDTFAGDEDTYAGTITVYSVIADGDRAVGKLVDQVNANLGAFEASATSQLVAMATAVAASAEKVDVVQAELDGKASAESVSQLRSSVEQNADGIEAVAESLQSVKVDLDGKASAQVVSGMETRVQQNEQGLIQVLARAFMQVMADAGGGPLIGGMVIDNDGHVVNTRFLSTTFEVVAPGAASGMELRDGYLRVWGGNSQRIIGNGFGADGLMDYFGPNVGVAAANKFNATMWMDRNGDAYWGGTLRAGAINSSGQFNLNNANWDSASNISVIHAGSQGRTKVVLWSCRLSAEVISFGNSPQPTRTGTMRLRLWRDATLLWDESITASSANVYEVDSNRTLATQTWQWPQRSFTDTTSATGNIPYRMQIDFVGGTRYDIPAFVVGAEASVAVLNIIES